MASQDGSLPESFLDPAIVRADQISRALGGVFKAVELELSDVALNPHTLDHEMINKLQALGGTLLKLADLSIGLANDISTTVSGELATRETLLLADAQPQRSDSAVPQPITATEASQPAPTPSPILPTAVTTGAVKPTPPRRTAGHQGDGSGRLEQAQHLRRKQPSPKTPSTSDRRRGREAKQFEGELYEAIITDKRTPLMELREGMVPIDIKIISNDTLGINGNDVTLAGDTLYLFNALMRLREKPRKGTEIREMGFRPGDGESTKAAYFNKAMKELRAEINTVAGVEIFKQLGQTRKTVYCVNPCAVLIDVRGQTPGASETPDGVKKN